MHFKKKNYIYNYINVLLLNCMCTRDIAKI